MRGTCAGVPSGGGGVRSTRHGVGEAGILLLAGSLPCRPGEWWGVGCGLQEQLLVDTVLAKPNAQRRPVGGRHTRSTH